MNFFILIFSFFSIFTVSVVNAKSALVTIDIPSVSAPLSTDFVSVFESHCIGYATNGLCDMFRLDASEALLTYMFESVLFAHLYFFFIFVFFLLIYFLVRYVISSFHVNPHK